MSNSPGQVREKVLKKKRWNPFIWIPKRDRKGELLKKGEEI